MIIQGGRLQGARYQDKSPYVNSGLVLFLDAANPASYPEAGGTTWYDVSGHGNNVELAGGGILHPNGAPYLTLDSTAYFTRSSCNGVPTGNSPYTLSAWIQLNHTWSDNGIMSISDTFGTGSSVNAFRTGGDGYLFNYWWGNDLPAFFTSGNYSAWFNVVATYDGATRVIWVNGAGIATAPSGPVNVTNSFLQIGKTYSTEYFNGNYGQAMIYNRALTTDEILQNYNYFRTRYGV